MPCAFRIGRVPIWSATPSSNWIETTVSEPEGGGGPGVNGTVCHANASGDVADRSTAGSTVENDSMSSWNLPLVELNGANGPESSGGQLRMPDWNPRYSVPFGPSTTAPFRIVPVPSSEPSRFATWWWRHCGNLVPSPTMNEEPQALAPRTFASQRPLQAACSPDPVSSATSRAVTESPVPWDAVSQVDQGKPNWKGSALARARALSSAFFRSATRSAWVTSRPIGLPFCSIALWSA